MIPLSDSEFARLADKKGKVVRDIATWLSLANRMPAWMITKETPVELEMEVRFRTEYNNFAQVILEAQDMLSSIEGVIVSVRGEEARILTIHLEFK